MSTPVLYAAENPRSCLGIKLNVQTQVTAVAVVNIAVYIVAALCIGDPIALRYTIIFGLSLVISVIIAHETRFPQLILPYLVFTALQTAIAITVVMIAYGKVLANLFDQAVYINRKLESTRLLFSRDDMEYLIAANITLCVALIMLAAFVSMFFWIVPSLLVSVTWRDYKSLRAYNNW